MGYFFTEVTGMHSRGPNVKCSFSSKCRNLKIEFSRSVETVDQNNEAVILMPYLKDVLNFSDIFILG
jgi:hypothetical protein